MQTTALAVSRVTRISPEELVEIARYFFLGRYACERWPKIEKLLKERVQNGDTSECLLATKDGCAYALLIQKIENKEMLIEHLFMRSDENSEFEDLKPEVEQLLDMGFEFSISSRDRGMFPEFDHFALAPTLPRAIKKIAEQMLS